MAKILKPRLATDISDPSVDENDVKILAGGTIAQFHLYIASIASVLR